MADWPITFDDVRAASERLRPHLSPTPVRGYGLLDEAVGRGVRVRVKHENFQPTGAFKVRNGVSALGALAPEVRRRGVVAATRGNHGLGLAWDIEEPSGKMHRRLSSEQTKEDVVPR